MCDRRVLYVTLVSAFAHTVVCFALVSGSNAIFLISRIKRQTTCSPLEFKCANSRQCINSYLVCDGAKDCADGSDEQRSTCRALNIRCPSLSFQCSYGACIDKGLRCNGQPDCADKSDERGCDSSTADCRSGNFNCSNGQCVDQYAVCDGNNDCTDGSDETQERCGTLKCPSSSFQCDYGACLEHSVRCNGVSDCPDGSDEKNCPDGSLKPSNDVNSAPAGGCSLPSHPQHGVYESSQCQPGDVRAACRNTPGTPVHHSWLLKYSCNANYQLSSSYEYSVCDNGVWKNLLDCVKLCPPLESLSVDVRCVHEGRDVPCEHAMKPGTTATAQCKQHYQQTYRPEYSRLTCLPGGQWNYHLFYCTPDCGTPRKATDLVPLISNGSPSSQGEFPWLTAIFLKDESGQWQQKCGGTLISSHLVLTAAHCLVFLEGILKPEDVKVGLGKYYRNFYKYEQFSVIADVKEIVIPPFYSGEASYYALDIALLDLTVSVAVSSHIMPACVDWNPYQTVYPDNIGHVSGWGTTDDSTPSEVVMSAQLRYIHNAACIRRVRAAFKRLVTHDKFCVESVNGSQVAQGDSGGGLTAVRNGQHFVIGVVSTKLSGSTAFSLFTNISNAEHFSWMEQQRTRLDSLHRQTPHTSS